MIHTDIIEYRVIEYAPGKFAPVVAKDGEWEFTGGRVFGSAESAALAAPDEIAFTKKFWDMQLADRSNAVVVGGVHYRLGSAPDTRRPEFRGNYGRTFHLKSLATGEVIRCSDLWYQGGIPDFARPYFPDTHEFTAGPDA